MASLNKVLLIGNLTKDPEVRTIPSGINVADLRMAISETYTDKNGQKVDKACFVDVVFWDKQADVCKNYLTKGSPLLVEGRLQMDEWTSKEGEKRSKLRVRGERLQLLGSKREPGAAPAGRAPGRPAEDDGRPAEDLGEPAAAPADGDTPF